MKRKELIELTADIVGAHVSNNHISVSDIPIVIQSVHEALQAIGQRSQTPEPSAQPAVSARASVKQNYIACMACGRKQQMLRRHIAVAHGLSPEQYRHAYDLPLSYPMTAPSYSERRRQIATDAGLGRRKEPQKRKRLSIRAG